MPFDYVVRRRFNDFVWLRETLVKEYPGCYIPPLPIKGVKRSFDDSYVADRQNFLQIFLDQAAEHPEILASIYFSSFLKCKDQEMFDKMKKESNKHNSQISNFHQKFHKKLKKTRFTDFLHADGKLRSQISPDLNLFSNCLD